MLMLGESVLSLLIVDNEHEGDHYQTVFFAGVLTIILLRLLHFQSQPHGAEAHAARRNKDAGLIVFIIFNFLLPQSSTTLLSDSSQPIQTK
jgi:hypothetical protein